MKNLKKVLKEVSTGKNEPIFIPDYVKMVKYKDIKDKKIRDEAYDLLLLIDKIMEKKGYGVIYDKNKDEVGLYNDGFKHPLLKKANVFLVTEY